MDIAFPETPIEDRHTIRAEWTGPDGRMTPTGAILIFDGHTSIWRRLGLDWEYLKTSHFSTFVVEAHYTLGADVRLGEEVRVTSQILDADEKRVHVFHAMRRGDDDRQVGTYEIMILHVDMNARRSAPMPPPVWERVKALAAAHARLPRPAEAGHRIAA